MFERGFKSWCENVSLSIRAELGIADKAPLPPDTLAAYLDVMLWTPQKLEGLRASDKTVLVEEEAANWSAITVSDGDSHAVVYNPTHSTARRSSDIMHELSHLVIEHEPSTIVLSPDGSLALRTFDRQQEDEASWLAGCLLIPRPALLAIAASGMQGAEACRKYGVSRDLLTYRLNVTGVTAQIRYRRRRSTPA